MANTTRIDNDPIRRMAGMLPLGTDAAAIRQRVVAMEHLLEGLFTIPGTNRKVGLDVLIGIVPVAGDVIAAAMGSWLVWEARNLGMSKLQMARMFGNVGTDFLLGLIPIIGVVPDFFFRSNTRNLRIIKKHLDKHHPSTATVEG
ncbi:DUF4112 domain-containing protein [Sphingomonas sp. GB1N7]|uniref:DUF4112 domain-containing protein n=1 Tax=Parasphingomonas caseinilytica TaxID=3096158 RepID=UPI003FA7CE03